MELVPASRVLTFATMGVGKDNNLPENEDIAGKEDD